MIVDGWFREENELWPGQAFSLKVKKVLYEGKTKFQDVLVFESETYGNVLILDGVFQTTERDEFAYQEMISHIPLMAHKNPLKVLIVGGGDGGCVREVLKHEQVESVHVCEIDETVIELSKKYLPNLAKHLDDERVTVFVEDGFEFLKHHIGEYDVIISDTSDPEGPAEALFQEGYFRLLYNALKPDGVISLMASENIWLKIELLKSLQKTIKAVFPVVKYSAVHMPTYTSGQLGMMVCSKNPDTDVKAAQRTWDGVKDLKYYSPAVHAASFVLPTMALKYIDNE